MSAVVALVAAPRADTAEASEFLRVLAALRACGRAVELIEVGRGVGAMSGEDAALSTEGSRYLDALAADGVAPRVGADAATAIAAATSVIVLADPSRAGIPALLRLRRGERPTLGEVRDLERAGQVVLG